MFLLTCRTSLENSRKKKQSLTVWIEERKGQRRSLLLGPRIVSIILAECEKATITRGVTEYCLVGWCVFVPDVCLPIQYFNV